jgi:hypothetical protein
VQLAQHNIGEVDLAGIPEHKEETELSRLRKSKAKKQRLPEIQFPSLVPLAAAFGPCLKKVRFPDPAAEWTGFRVLSRSGDPLEFLENGEHGVTSQRQVTLLREQNIPCEILD